MYISALYCVHGSCIIFRLPLLCPDRQGFVAGEMARQIDVVHRRRRMNAMNRVLIVDDDDATRLALSSCLVSCGYETIEAADGMEALLRLQTGAYALVITDYRMPGLSGIELIQIVRRKWKIPVLLISGHLTETEEQVAILSDARVLRKPIDRDALLPIVKLAVQQGNINDR